MWRGNSVVAREGFSKRREYLNEFVKHHWVPDARLLGGIFTSIAQPMSLEEFAARRDWSNCHSIELIPEMPGKRRMVWFLEARVKAAEAHAGLKQGREAVPTALPTALPKASQIPVTHVKRALAAQVDRLPDVYNLIGEDGAVFDRASVQQFRLSQQLREATKEAQQAVELEWNAEFGGYMITGLCS
jgi:hypothetical protein